MAKPYIITIDGGVSCGKSSLVVALGVRFQASWLSTGILYRAFSKFWSEYYPQIMLCADSKDSKKVIEKINCLVSYLMKNLKIINNQVIIDNRDITLELSSQSIAKQASIYAVNYHLRTALIPWQRSLIEQCYSQAIFIDGRDAGSVVFCDADLKFFVTASIETRAQRRFVQIHDTIPNKSQLEQMIDEITQRDHRDKSRAHSPLVVPKDAVVIDSSKHKSIDDTLQEITEHIVDKLGKW